MTMNLSEDIRQFMSLREPQSEALRRLEQISEKTDYKSCTLATLSATAKASVDGNPELDFDTDFASFCFAIATGVGKTRLSDPDDEAFAHLAADARADALATFNISHFMPARARGIQVMTPAQFLAMLRLTP